MSIGLLPYTVVGSPQMAAKSRTAAGDSRSMFAIWTAVTPAAATFLPTRPK